MYTHSIHIYIYISIHTYTYTYICVCVHIPTDIHAYDCLFADIHVFLVQLHVPLFSTGTCESHSRLGSPFSETPIVPGYFGKLHKSLSKVEPDTVMNA